MQPVRAGDCISVVLQRRCTLSRITIIGKSATPMIHLHHHENGSQHQRRDQLALCLQRGPGQSIAVNFKLERAMGGSTKSQRTRFCSAAFAAVAFSASAQADKLRG